MVVMEYFDDTEARLDGQNIDSEESETVVFTEQLGTLGSLDSFDAVSNEKIELQNAEIFR